MSTNTSTPLATRRTFRPIPYRTTFFTDTTDLGAIMRGLAKCDEKAVRVLIVGDRPADDAGSLAGWASTLDPAAGTITRSYLDLDAPTLTITAGDAITGRPGQTVEIGRAAAWFGESAASPLAHTAAWSALRRVLAAEFDDVNILSTPATTGRECFLRTIPAHREYSVLDDAWQNLIRATSGQGRTEVIDRGERTGPLVAYDGRLMYGALLSKLPAGPMRALEGDAADEFATANPYAQGRYRVDFTVPPDWDTACICGAPGHAGIGVLPVARDGGGWHYPSEPGYTGVTWADGAEIHVARKHGIAVNCLEAIVWPEQHKPLDVWAGRLGRAYLRHVHQRGTGPQLVRAALRAVILHTIGAFHGSRPHVTASAPIDRPDRIPHDARQVRSDGDRWVWSTVGEQRWPELAHPEWSAAVYGRARARLLDGPGGTGALNVPAETVVGFATDALYLSADPQWPDDGQLGRLRRKAHYGTVTHPRTRGELLAITREAGA